jgi:hypothetical protein
VKDALYFAERVEEGAKRDSQSALAGCIRFIASLSRVDGLVLMSSDLNVLGFGTEILTEADVPRFCLASGAHATPKQLQEKDPKHYGMRHRSMMRYCAANPRSIGFVVSEDGDVRAVMRHQRKLVMWDNIQLQVAFDRDPEDKTARTSKPIRRLR